MARVRLSLFLILSLLAFEPPARSLAGDAAVPQSLEISPLSIETAEGRVSFEVELAQTPEAWSLGLMYRRDMAATHGMLFFFPGPRVITMWMKNTFIPLDMVFILPDGTISSIAENTVPESLEVVSSRGLASAVLELNAGSAKKFGIRPGDRVRHAAFGTVPSGESPE